MGLSEKKVPHNQWFIIMFAIHINIWWGILVSSIVKQTQMKSICCFSFNQVPFSRQPQFFLAESALSIGWVEPIV